MNTTINCYKLIDVETPAPRPIHKSYAVGIKDFNDVNAGDILFVGDNGNLSAVVCYPLSATKTPITNVRLITQLTINIVDALRTQSYVASIQFKFQNHYAASNLGKLFTSLYNLELSELDNPVLMAFIKTVYKTIEPLMQLNLTKHPEVTKLVEEEEPVFEAMTKMQIKEEKKLLKQKAALLMAQRGANNGTK